MAEKIDPGDGYRAFVRLRVSGMSEAEGSTTTLVVPWPEIDVERAAANDGYDLEVDLAERRSKKFVRHVSQGLEHWQATRT